MNKKNGKKVVGLVLALTLVFGNTNVFASGNNGEPTSDLSRAEASFNKINDIAMNSVEVKDSQRINQAKELVENSIKEKTSNLNFINGELIFDEAKLLDISEGDDIYTSITIPIKGNIYSTISNATFVFQNNQIITYTETLITKGDNNKFVIDTYFGGSLLESNHTDIDFISNSEIQQGLDAIQENAISGNQYVQTRGGAEIAGCLAVVLGVCFLQVLFGESCRHFSRCCIGKFPKVAETRFDAF